jgi:hypothetical protein
VSNFSDNNNRIFGLGGNWRLMVVWVLVVCFFWVVGVIDLSEKMKYRSRYGEFEREGDFGCGLSRYCVVLDLM